MRTECAVNTWAQHPTEGPGAALHTWASAAGNQSCTKANQAQHRARSSDFTMWLADYSADSACCHPKNMQGFLQTSLPGISQEALPAPQHCFFPQVQHSRPPCVEAGGAGPTGRTTTPWIPVSVGKEPRWSRTQLHAGRTRAISSRGGAAAIKMAVYCSRAQFSQDCLPSLPTAEPAGTSTVQVLFRKRHLACRWNSKQSERPRTATRKWHRLGNTHTHTPFSLLKLHACNEKMLLVRL